MALINFNNAHIEVINTNCFTSSDNAYWYLNLGMRQYDVLTGETRDLTSSSASVVDVNINGFNLKLEEMTTNDLMIEGKIEGIDYENIIDEEE